MPAGVVSTKIFFCLDARVELTAEERSDVTKYKLGSLVIYNSEAAKKHLGASVAAVATGSAMRVANPVAVGSLEQEPSLEGTAYVALREANRALVCLDKSATCETNLTASISAISEPSAASDTW